MTHIIFTDGACLGNPGPGGWGLIFADQAGQVVEKGGYQAQTTNNRMEMQAILESMKLLHNKKGKCILYSDSTYALKGLTEWLPAWRSQNWTTSSGKPVANEDLWRQMAEEYDRLSRRSDLEIKWQYVKGHAGLPGNERADAIASGFASQSSLELYEGERAEYPTSLEVPSSLPVAPKKPKPKGGKAPYGYVSYVEEQFHFDRQWRDCEARVKGRKGKVLFRKVFSEEEKELFRQRWSAK